MIRNPKNIKQEVKLWFFYMFDLGIVAGMTMFGVYIAKIFPLQPLVVTLVWIVFFLLGIFLCVRVPKNPNDRMISMIVYSLLTDRHTYEEISYEDHLKIKNNL